MTPIATLAPSKRAPGIAFLGLGSIFILSKPLFTPGGLEALIAGTDDGRGWWPIMALAAVVLLPMMALSIWRLVRWKGPAIWIADQQLYAFPSGKPTPLSEIVDVELSTKSWIAPPTIVVRCRDLQTRKIVLAAMREPPIEVLGRLRAELRLVRP